MILNVETSVVIGFAIFLVLTIIAVTLIAKWTEKKSSKAIHAFEALTLTTIGKKEKENKKKAESSQKKSKKKRTTRKRRKTPSEIRKKSPDSKSKNTLEFNQELKTESTIQEPKPPIIQDTPKTVTKPPQPEEKKSLRFTSKPESQPQVQPIIDSDSMVISVIDDKEVSLEDTSCNLRAIGDGLIHKGFAASPARDTDKYESQMYDAAGAVEKWLEAQKNAPTDQIPVFNGKFDPNLEETKDTLGDTAQKISELDNLFQEIDRIVDYISPKSSENASTNSLSREFQEKVNQSFQQKGLSEQDFTKILDDLNIPPVPNEESPKEQQDLPEKNDNPPKGTPESIEKWKKMLGF